MSFIDFLPPHKLISHTHTHTMTPKEEEYDDDGEEETNIKHYSMFAYILRNRGNREKPSRELKAGKSFSFYDTLKKKLLSLKFICIEREEMVRERDM